MTKHVRVINRNRDIGSPPRVQYCDTFLTQLRGLTFRPHLSRDGGLILVGTRDSRLDSSIHMLFVSFDLCVVWINSEMKVVDKVIARSWRPAYFSKRPAKFVLEVHPDRWSNFEIGDAVEFENA
ncbi:MAG: hypothetical protein MHPDNHAH_02482 [Anaerolineales bacterium]|nr:hypothetical protein [Anaerolineales bacterium]